jgi:hypothetical protein
MIFFLPGIRAGVDKDKDKDKSPFRLHKTVWPRVDKNNSSPTFTTFDYVCSTISKLGPAQGEPGMWEDLVTSPAGWNSFYTVDQEVLDMGRAQLPASSGDSSHFASWSSEPSPWS